MSEATVPWLIVHLNMPHQEVQELPNQNSTQSHKSSQSYKWINECAYKSFDHCGLLLTVFHSTSNELYRQVLKLESSRYFLHLMELKHLGKSWWKQDCFSIPKMLLWGLWNGLILLSTDSPPSAQLPARVLAGFWCVLLSEIGMVPVPDV